MESNADEILPKDEKENVGFLVIDPFGATTHSDLILRARERNLKVKGRNFRTKDGLEYRKI